MIQLEFGALAGRIVAMQLEKQTLLQMLDGINSQHQGVVLQHGVDIQTEGGHQIHIAQRVGSVTNVFRKDILPEGNCFN